MLRREEKATIADLVSWLKYRVGQGFDTRVRPYTMWDRPDVPGARGGFKTVGLEVAGTSSSYRGNNIIWCSDPVISNLHERWPTTVKDQWTKHLNFVGTVKALVLLLGDAAPDPKVLKAEAKKIREQAEADAHARRMAYWAKQVNTKFEELKKLLDEHPNSTPDAFRGKVAEAHIWFSTVHATHITKDA